MAKKKMMGERDPMPAATPFSHFDSVPHSGDGMKHGGGKKLRGERTWSGSTPYNHDASTQPNMKALKAGKMPAKPSMATPMGHFEPVPHSGDKAHGRPKPVKKWSKKNYSMDAPSSMPAGDQRNGGSSLS